MKEASDIGDEVKCARCGVLFWVFGFLRLPFLCSACEDVSYDA